MAHIKKKSEKNIKWSKAIQFLGWELYYSFWHTVRVQEALVNSLMRE